MDRTPPFQGGNRSSILRIPIMIYFDILKNNKCFLFDERSICVPSGWEPIFVSMIQEIAKFALNNNITIKIAQVKSKIGSLRFYYDIDKENYKSDIDSIINRYALLCMKTCEGCGSKENLNRGWRVMCQKCGGK